MYCQYSYDPYRFEGAGRHTEVWFSEVVGIVSEWRVFVCRGDVLAITRVPDEKDEEEARGIIVGASPLNGRGSRMCRSLLH